MSYTTCLNCKVRQPRYRSSCRRCNAPLTSNERERRRELRRESELRELNGKEPLDVPTTDESVEEVERWDGVVVLLLLLLGFAGMVVYLLGTILGWWA